MSPRIAQAGQPVGAATARRQAGTRWGVGAPVRVVYSATEPLTQRPGSLQSSPCSTVKPRPSRWAVGGGLPEGRWNPFDAETGSGPEGSSLTVNDLRLEGHGVESGGGALEGVPVRTSGASPPAKGRRLR